MKDIIKYNQRQGGIWLILCVLFIVFIPISPYEILDIVLGVAVGFLGLMSGIFSGIAAILIKLNGEK